MLGVFKDELNGFPMKEFVGIRPESYAYLQDNDKISKSAKGVKKLCHKEKF